MKPKDKTFTIYIIYALVLVIFVVVGIHVINAIDHNTDSETGKVDLVATMNEFEQSIEKDTFKFEMTKSVPAGLFFMGIALVVFVGWQMDAAKKQRLPGGEYGTAKWHNPKELKKYWDKDDDKNIILTQKLKFVWDNEKTGINMNSICFGVAGSGKTFNYFKPNVLNCYGCYVIVDPKLDILAKEGHVLKNNGYDIKMYNIDDLANSNYYNPLVYAQEDDDVIFLVKSLLLNTKADQNASSSDGFWDDASELLLLTLISYVKYCYPKEKQTIPDVLSLMLEANEYQTRTPEGKAKPEEITLLDLKIEDLEKSIAKKKEENPGCACPESVVIEHYKGFKLAPKKTSMSILISVMARLKFFNIETIRQASLKDEMELDMIGRKKMAIFISIPPTDRSKDFLSSIMFTQILKIIERNAKASPKNKLDMPTRIMIDEAKNVGKIPNIVEAIAYVRSFDAGVTLVYQSLAQVQEQYKDEWKEIIDNCDSFLFLKGNEVETTKYISDKLGNTTIYTKNRSVSRGSNASYSDNEQAMARKLLEPDEVGKLKKNECIVFVQGVPYFERKYNTLKHPRIKETCEYKPTWFEKKRGFKTVEPFDFKKELYRKRRKKSDILGKAQYHDDSRNSDNSNIENFVSNTESDAANPIDLTQLEKSLSEQVNAVIQTVGQEVPVEKSVENSEHGTVSDSIVSLINEYIANNMENLQARAEGINLEQFGIEDTDSVQNVIKEMIKEEGYQITEEIEKLIAEQIRLNIHLEENEIQEKSDHSGRDKENVLSTIVDNMEKENDPPAFLAEKIRQESNSREKSVSKVIISAEQLKESGMFDLEVIDEENIEEVEENSLEDNLMDMMKDFKNR